MGHSNNILLTGLPRSGTTLMCFLLNKLENSVALHEPLPVVRMKAMNDDELIHAIDQFFNDQRYSITKDRIAVSKSNFGKVPSNPLSDEQINGKRVRMITGNEICINNVTDQTFSLYIKHPAFFTARLELLTSHYTCYASIRNPLSILLSWRCSDMNISRGRVPAAESSDSRLRMTLDSEPDILRRQLLILDYFFGAYSKYLDGRVVRYEDIISSRGKLLQCMSADGGQLDEELTCRNKRLLAIDPDAEHIAQMLVSRDSPCWNFYDRSDVANMFCK